jgi:hypothetical protein
MIGLPATRLAMRLQIASPQKNPESAGEENHGTQDHCDDRQDPIAQTRDD